MGWCYLPRNGARRIAMDNGGRVLGLDKRGFDA